MARKKVWQDKVAEVFAGCTAEQAGERLALARTIVNVLHPPKPKVKSKGRKVNAKDTPITESERATMQRDATHSG